MELFRPNPFSFLKEPCKESSLQETPAMSWVDCQFGALSLGRKSKTLPTLFLLMVFLDGFFLVLLHWTAMLKWYTILAKPKKETSQVSMSAPKGIWHIWLWRVHFAAVCHDRLAPFKTFTTSSSSFVWSSLDWLCGSTICSTSDCWQQKSRSNYVSCRFHVCSSSFSTRLF